MIALLDDGDYTKPNNGIDNLLSEELLQLSMRDRNAIDEEIHCVKTLAPVESPEFLTAALFELSEEVDAIPDDSPSKVAYMESQRYPKTYVNSSDFRLRFLRCELFDAKKAASRMITFLSLTSDLFGPELLQRPVRMTDFSKVEEKLIRTGNVQTLPYRDRAGRPIFAWVGDFGYDQGTARSRVRLIIYLSYTMMDDIESQRKGVTKLIWVGSNKIDGSSPNWEDIQIFRKAFDAIPMRVCSVHFCAPDNPYFHVLRSMYAIAVKNGKSSLSRMKFHIGEEVQMLYKLKSYGIPVELIPVTGTGNIKTIYWKQWMRFRKNLDDMRAKGINDMSVDCPGSTDVLFRTGTSLTCHPGNSMFQSIIESKMQEHSAASQVEKMAITKEIIDTVKDRGGRFLQWNTHDWWTELKGASHIHTKVAVSVRDFKSKLVAKQNRQTYQCSTSLFQNQDGKRRKISRDDGFNSDSSGNQESCCLR